MTPDEAAKWAARRRAEQPTQALTPVELADALSMALQTEAQGGAYRGDPLSGRVEQDENDALDAIILGTGVDAMQNGTRHIEEALRRRSEALTRKR